MNELDPRRRPQRAGTAMLMAGLVMMLVPAICLVIVIISTGVTVHPGAESAFYGLVYLGLGAGLCSFPIGLVLLIFGIVQLAKAK